MFHKQAETVPLKTTKTMKKKKKNEEKQSSCDRGPLQELKRVPRSSNTSFPCSSTSVSVEAPGGCLRFLLSANSNSCSASSSSSSLCKPQCQRKPKSLSKLGNKPMSTTPKSAPNSTRLRSKASKENDLSRVTSQKSKKNPSFLSQWQSGKKPSLKTTKASKLSSNLSNYVKNSASDSEGFRADRKDLKQMEQENNGSAPGQPAEFFSFKVSKNPNSTDNCTPVGKLPCWSALDSSVFDDKPVVGGDSNSANTKTPPIEASLSPEIQSGVSNLLVSAATPVCYGVGHLLSGVSDKRKCKPRGILTIGDIDNSVCEEINTCADHGHEIATEILTKSRPSFIPLPTEASMRWLSSPHGENGQKCDSADQCMTLLNSSTIGLPFSPSNCFPSDLVSDSQDIYQSSNFDATRSTGKTRIVLLSPRRAPNSQGFSGPSHNKKEVYLFAATPQSNSSGHDIDCPPKEGNFSYRSVGDSIVGEKSPPSSGFCSSANVVQTPKSDSSSDMLIDISDIDAGDSLRNEFDLHIDSVAEAFDRTSLSPRSHTLKWDPPGLSSQFSDISPPSHAIKDLGSCASWVSDSTLQTMSLSQMRISWREGLVSRILDSDEFDCCRCLSDEEKDGGESDKLPKESSPKPFESITSEQQNPFDIDGLNSPEFLEQEPRILGIGKGKFSPADDNVRPESISIDGGGLVSSGDSDWTLCYKNHLFEV